MFANASAGEAYGNKASQAAYVSEGSSMCSQLLCEVTYMYTVHTKCRIIFLRASDYTKRYSLRIPRGEGAQAGRDPVYGCTH